MEKNFSWVVPCFNEEKVILETLKRIRKVSKKINKYNWELILINDGITDITKFHFLELKDYPLKIILSSFYKKFWASAGCSSFFHILYSASVII